MLNIWDIIHGFARNSPMSVTTGVAMGLALSVMLSVALGFALVLYGFFVFQNSKLFSITLFG